MLSIALGLLKIIGVVLLALLVLILLALCLFLFVPVRYQAYIIANKLDVIVDANASWLLKLIRLRYIRKAGFEEISVYVFWFIKIRIDDKKDKNDKKTKVSKKVVSDIKPHEKNLEAKRSVPEVTEVQDIEGAGGVESKPARTSAAAEQHKEGIFSRIKKVIGQINYYRRYPNRKEIISATWGLIKKLCKKLLPRKLRLSGKVGLHDPHKTAYLFAAAGALCLPVSGIEPVFDEQVLRLDLYARGKLSLWSILWPLLRYAIKRPIWPLTKKIIFRKGDGNE